MPNNRQRTGLVAIDMFYLRLGHTSKLIIFSIVVLIHSSAYATDNEVNITCKRIASKLASISLSECLERNLRTSTSYSENNTPLLIKEYPPLGSREPQARILLLGGIHGDEYSSVTIMFKWMSILDKHHSGLFHWKVAPLINPDGLLRRKSQRMNANGVDLNRNFKNGINDNAGLQYWQKYTNSDPRRYPGKKPMSEVETQWMHQLITEFRPDAIVAVHAPYGIVDFDGPPKPPTHLGPLHLHLLGTYPGSLGNFAGEQLDIPVVTVELPYAGIMPSEQEVSRIWIDLIRWLKGNVPKDETRKSRQIAIKNSLLDD
ncbi:MAG: M14 family zinc carboxypeptidase [Gammaproteobacteria bacterium]|nr:M14 family zinc carboxypeptidase [Gammaproteobacteria bacterium]MDH5736445.1 M14 family zinc carboxypeptidase [Gammaproteobacteria bacterium]